MAMHHPFTMPYEEDLPYLMTDPARVRSQAYDVVLNGIKVGENGINAALCGAMGVPVALVTGDLAACWEAESLLGPNLVTCGLKEGHGRHSAELLPPDETAPLLQRPGGACPVGITGT